MADSNVHRRKWAVRVLWEPRDLWLGVYWTRDLWLDPAGYRWRVYVCLLPCVPLRIEWFRSGAMLAYKVGTGQMTEAEARSQMGRTPIEAIDGFGPEDVRQLEETKRRWRIARRPSARRLLFGRGRK